MDLSDFEGIPFEDEYTQEEKDKLILGALKELNNVKNRNKDRNEE